MITYDNKLVQNYQILATWFCVCNAELFIKKLRNLHCKDKLRGVAKG